MEDRAVRNITNVPDLLHWLIMSNDDNTELQLSFLLGYRIFFSSTEIVMALENMSRSLAKNNLQGDIVKFNKFLNLWITKVFQLDWKRSATLPLFFEVMKVTMPAEEYNNLRAVCAKVSLFHTVLLL
jgi:hypothetical protein